MAEEEKERDRKPYYEQLRVVGAAAECRPPSEIIKSLRTSRLTVNKRNKRRVNVGQKEERLKKLGAGKKIEISRVE